MNRRGHLEHRPRSPRAEAVGAVSHGAVCRPWDGHLSRPARSADPARGFLPASPQSGLKEEKAARIISDRKPRL